MNQPFAKSTGSIALSLCLLAAASTNSMAISVTADQVTVSEDTPAVIDVLSNDSAEVGATLVTSSLTISDAPDNGYAVIENGKIVYQGNQHFNGSDTLVYQITDSNNNTDTGTVHITIDSIDDPSIFTTQLPFLAVQQNTETSYTLPGSDGDGGTSPIIFHASASEFPSTSVSGYETTFTISRLGINRANIFFGEGTNPNVLSTIHGQFYPFFFEVHGTVADKVAEQTVPVTATSGQPIDLSYRYSQRALFGTASAITQQLQIVLTGKFNITSVPDTCNPVAPDFIWQQFGTVTIRCTPPAAINSDDVTITITPTSTGVINSNLVVTSASGEGRTDNNSSTKIINVITTSPRDPSQQISRAAATSIASADADGDGDLDILVTPQGFGQAQWYINDGEGTLTAGGTLSGYINTQKIVVGDLNNDNIDEIVLVARDGSLQQYQRVNNEYILQAAIAEWGTGISLNETITNAHLADLNNDNYPELVTTADFFSNGTIFTNQNGVLQAATSAFQTSQLGGFSAALADFNNDNRIDAIFPRRFDPVEVYFNNGNSDATAALAEQSPSPIASTYALQMTSALISDDNLPDLITVGTAFAPILGLDPATPHIDRAGSLRLYVNSGSSPWLPSTPTTSITTQPITGITAVNFDSDTDTDVIISTTEDVAYVLTNGTEATLVFSDIAYNLPVRSKFTTADINGDGFQEIIAASTTTGGLATFSNPAGTQLPLIAPGGNSQANAGGGGGGNMLFIFVLILGGFLFYQLYYQRRKKQ